MKIPIYLQNLPKADQTAALERAVAEKRIGAKRAVELARTLKLPEPERFAHIKVGTHSYGDGASRADADANPLGASSAIFAQHSTTIAEARIALTSAESAGVRRGLERLAGDPQGLVAAVGSGWTLEAQAERKPRQETVYDLGQGQLRVRTGDVARLELRPPPGGAPIQQRIEVGLDVGSKGADLKQSVKALFAGAAFAKTPELDLANRPKVEHTMRMQRFILTAGSDQPTAPGVTVDIDWVEHDYDRGEKGRKTIAELEVSSFADDKAKPIFEAVQALVAAARGDRS